MHDAQLDLGLGKYGPHRIWKINQTVYASYKYIINVTVLQVSDDTHPEMGCGGCRSCLLFLHPKSD